MAELKEAELDGLLSYADEAGLRRLVRQFSTPGGIPSHVSVPTPGSIHEGGELGYALVHAFGAAFDNPDLLVACVIGDGEAETAPLEGSWKGVRFLNPSRDGAVLPILHLNENKISGPTVLGRAPEEEIVALLAGHGPLGGVRENPEHLAMLEAWMRSYRPEERFDSSGRLVSELADLAPAGEKRMGATSHANGGHRLVPLEIPDPASYAIELERPATDRESGLLGLSLRSGDMREVIAGKDQGDERCRLAFDAYIHRLAAGIAAMAAAMGGIDALSFTGGVGENSSRVRAAACSASGFLGITLDEEKNDAPRGDRVMSSADGTVAVLVLAAREDIELAAQVRRSL